VIGFKCTDGGWEKCVDALLNNFDGVTEPVTLHQRTGYCLIALLFARSVHTRVRFVSYALWFANWGSWFLTDRPQFVPYLCGFFHIVYFPVTLHWSVLCVEEYWVALLSVVGFHLWYLVVVVASDVVVAFPCLLLTRLRYLFGSLQGLIWWLCGPSSNILINIHTNNSRDMKRVSKQKALRLTKKHATLHRMNLREIFQVL